MNLLPTPRKRSQMGVKGTAQEPLLSHRVSINALSASACVEDPFNAALDRFVSAAEGGEGSGSAHFVGRAKRRKESKKQSCWDSARCHACENACCCVNSRKCCGSRRCRNIRHIMWEVLSVKASKYGSYSRFWPSRIFEFFILSLVLVNVVLVIFFASKSSGTETPEANMAYQAFELASAIVFTIEYCLRLWACVEDKRYSRPIVGRLKWLVKPLSLLDLIFIIPYYLDFILISIHTRGLTVVSVLRIFKVFSFLRMERQSKAFKRLAKVFKKRQYELIVTVFVAATLFLISSTIMYYLEPKTFPTVPDAMWWSINTLTSVGYGDALPTTAGGKVLSGVVAFLGIGLFALPAGILGSGFVEIMYDELGGEGDGREEGEGEEGEEEEEEGLLTTTAEGGLDKTERSGGGRLSEDVGREFEERDGGGGRLERLEGEVSEKRPLPTAGTEAAEAAESTRGLFVSGGGSGGAIGQGGSQSSQRRRRNSDSSLGGGSGHVSAAVLLARDFVRKRDEFRRHKEELMALHSDRRSLSSETHRPPAHHGRRWRRRAEGSGQEHVLQVDCPHCKTGFAVQVDLHARPRAIVQEH